MPPPKYTYVPDVEVSVMAYVKAIAGGHQYHPRRFSVLVPVEHKYADLRASWDILYGSAWSLLGTLNRIETEISYLAISRIVV